MKFTKVFKFILTIAIVLTSSCFAFGVDITTEAKLHYNKGIDYYQLGQFEESANCFKKAIELAIPEGNKFIKVEIDGTNVVLTGTNNYMTFDKVNLGKAVPLACPADTCEVEYVTVPEFGTVDANVEDFATKQ